MRNHTRLIAFLFSHLVYPPVRCKLLPKFRDGCWERSVSKKQKKNKNRSASLKVAPVSIKKRLAPRQDCLPAIIYVWRVEKEDFSDVADWPKLTCHFFFSSCRMYVRLIMPRPGVGLRILDQTFGKRLHTSHFTKLVNIHRWSSVTSSFFFIVIQRIHDYIIEKAPQHVKLV